MDNVFDPEFFPTPEEVIEKMLAPYAATISSATILEPSAGNGAILDYLYNKGVPYTYETGRGQRLSDRIKVDRTRLYAIERNEELRLILQGKKYKVIASDFLTFVPEHRFTLCAMNPPFSVGVNHLLHAWDILSGGDIVCLLNAETVRNPFTATRKRLAAIIEQNGSVEFIGRAFRHADNPTDVEIAIVRLHKEATENPFKIDIQEFERDNTPDFREMMQETDQVAVNNQLDAYLRCWSMTKAATENLLKAYSTFMFYATAFLENKMKGHYGYRSYDVVKNLFENLNELRYKYGEGIDSFTSSNQQLASVYNTLIDELKAKAWNIIFAQIGLGKYMTTGLEQKLNEFRTAQGAMSLTKENIFKLFQFIMGNIKTIMDNCVVDVYDLFTKFYDGNTACDEGWKTNKRYKCNRKIILPYACETSYSGYYRSNYTAHLDDIDKAMCWLTGRKFETMNNQSYDVCTRWRKADPDNSTVETVVNSIPVGDQSWHDGAFFRVKAFKKGTIHLLFKDEALWAKFNVAVNKGKNQIGEAE